MELTKKTTILFPEDLYRHLARVARRRGVSVGELVRRACAKEYGHATTDDRLQAVAELAELSLPVDTPEAMARESVPEVMPAPP